MSLSRILRLSRFDRSSDAVRIKAIIAMAMAIVTILIFDFVLLYKLLGPRIDYAVPLLICLGVVIILVASYRYHHKFYVAGLGFTLILCAMTYVAASVDKSGIQTALLPFLPIAIISAGFVSGWRMALLSTIAVAGVIAALFFQTASNTADGTIGTAIANPVYLNKMFQLSLACFVATWISTSLSLAMHGLFKKDETNLEKVQMAERQRTAFLSSLSHEVRTPLNGIIGMTGLLMQTDLTEKQKKYAENVHKSGENLMGVLGAVMEFSQVNNERIVLNPVTFDLHKLAHRLVQKYASMLHKNSDVLLGLHIAEQVPQYLFADAKRIEMILNHLLRNAVHFTPRGSINLLINGAELHNGKFRLCAYVRDTGVGIRQQDLKDIYRPFHQLDNRLSREHEGTGLGLSLCKETIEFMGGRLDVVSEFGFGSTFFFELPIVAVTPEDARFDSIRNAISDADDLSNVAVFRRAV